MKFYNRLFIPANNIEFKTGNEVFIVKAIELVNYGSEPGSITETQNLLLKFSINDEERIIIPFFLFSNTKNLYDSLSEDYLANKQYFENGIPNHKALIILKNELVLHPNTRAKCFLVDKSNSLQYFSSGSLSGEREKIGLLLYGYWLEKYEKQDLKINLYPYVFSVENYAYLLSVNQFDNTLISFIATDEMKISSKTYRFQRFFIINNTSFISYGMLRNFDNKRNYRTFKFFLSGIEYIDRKRKVRPIYITDYSAIENITENNYINNQFTYYDIDFSLRQREILKVLLRFVFNNNTQDFLASYSRLIRYITNNLTFYPFLFEFYYES
ncbi:MAG: hypothetical protein RMJ67_01140 [Elusimicrobiota bacterium]|nr:hypothetical protein [Endomicrobiia bacterium]MDW8165108.1 hypothetical protein [Elusimicrobiota bacterium]